MKKLFFAALLAVAVAGSAFAKDVKTVNSRAVASFSAEFKKASDVSWKTSDDYVKASFIMDGEKMEAFYNLDGDMIATSKSITIDELPVKAKRNFAKKFDGYNVKETIYFEGAEESAYYISAQNEKESVIVKIGDNASVSIYKKAGR